jgi:hypothetical protein
LKNYYYFIYIDELFLSDRLAVSFSPAVSKINHRADVDKGSFIAADMQ